jgi:predicted nucleotide-binding protein
MYSLLVIQQVEDRADGAFEISKGRFLEYTSEAIAAQLQPLSVEAIDCIKSWPCVLMQEGRGEERAYVGRITAVHDAGADIKLTIASYSNEPPILNDALWRIRTDLDIEQFEFNRNHWAIKDRDLFQVLRVAGYAFASSVVVLFEDKPLPAPRRPDLISARNIISEWSHTKIDDFLLEAGVAGLAAGRAIGSRRDRANAIVEFALARPATKTAENSLLSVFIVRAARLAAPDSYAESESTVTHETALKTLPEPAETESSSRSPNRVFVVHGQNDSARSAVVSFLSRVGLRGIVLHDQPNMGRHLLTKFIEEAELVTFAIVLMTDDDVGSLKGHKLAPRARQNVILELGYFLSHLGQERVCALITPGLETPSDFDGIVYIRMDADARWESELKRELLAAGMPLTESSNGTGAG